MLIKLGVEITRLDNSIRKKLGVINAVYMTIGFEPVITSTFEGNHIAGSWHYQNKAIDFRLPEQCPRTKPLPDYLDWNQVNSQLVIELKRKLGDDYDIILENSHIHIEFDPKHQRRRL